MDAIHSLKRDLVTANHILAHEGVVDGYGHVTAVTDPHLRAAFIGFATLATMQTDDDYVCTN